MQPVKPVIGIDDLDKIDIRVGTVLDVQEVPKSRKLVALQVDFGDFQRQILVGLKQEREDPTEVVGKQAAFVVNLAPRKMAGLVSEGMVFDVGFNDGVLPALLQPERPVPNGVQAG